MLGLLFGQPDRSFYATELIALTAAGSGAVQREVAKLEQSGLVTVSRLGTQKHYQANPDSPLFAELCGIVRKTVGLAEPLREVLAPLSPRVVAAFVYGSVAKSGDTAASDIDLMVVSDSLTYADVFAAVEPVSVKLGRPVNPTVTVDANWLGASRTATHSSRSAGTSQVWVIGTEGDLAP